MLLCGLSACGEHSLGKSFAAVLDDSPPVILITGDSLRRDHLGCYGYFRETSPNIDAFANESVVFERAVASMATTLPSHLTMLTGLYAHQHGMTSNHMAARSPFQPAEGRRSVAQILAAEGYRTAAFVSSAPVSEQTGIGVGFSEFDGPKKRVRKGKQTTDEVLAWLDQVDLQRPFFLWVHFWEPHDPNRPPEPYASMFTADSDLDDWIASCGVDRAAVAMAFKGQKTSELKRFLNEEEPDFDAAEIRDAFNRYDGDVRYLDDCVGRILAKLRERGLWERSIIAFAGDHGQALGEHGWLGHATIIDVNVFVPLILRFPDGILAQPRRLEPLVSLVDLMPTVLARIPGGARWVFIEQAEGEDILSSRFERTHVLTQQTDRVLCVPSLSGRRHALFEGRWKLVRKPGHPASLFDLEDRGEGWDVADLHPDVVQDLEATLDSLLTRQDFGTRKDNTGERSEEFVKALRELGYAGYE